jgi:hypothetical protein
VKELGMYDTIYNVPIKCPRCGDPESKEVQIKPGPQTLSAFDFGKDEIEVDWIYEYYGSIIDKDKKIIRGIAICEKCKKEANKNIENHIKDTFEVAIWLNEKNIPIAVDLIVKLNTQI